MGNKRRAAVIAVVGAHESGKTTLIEKLIPLLAERGYKVGTVKHSCHEEVEVDQAGTDSLRHRQAGSSAVVLSSAKKTFFIKQFEFPMTVEQTLELFDSEDVVLVEGYQGAGVPKIEVLRNVPGAELLAGWDPNVFAAYSETRVEAGVPVFSRDEIPGLVSLMEQEIIRQNGHRTG